MHSNSIGCPKILPLSAPVLYWLSHLTCISSLKVKNGRKTLVFTQLKMSDTSNIFSLFLEDLWPIDCSLTCLSRRYLLNCWTFCHQTLCGDESSWARVSCETEAGLLSSRSRSQWGFIQADTTVSTISTEPLILLQSNLIGWYIILIGVSCVQIDVVKAKVTVTVENFTESLTVLYFMFDWYPCNQSVAVQLLITKPNTKVVIYFFLACMDLGRMFDHFSPPALFCFVLFLFVF